MFPDRVETARLILRPPVDSDAAAVFHGYAQDAEVTRYLIWPPHTDIATTKKFLAECRRRWQASSGFPYAITQKGRSDPMGMIDVRPAGHRVTLGFVLARMHWGKGLMPECIKAIVAASWAAPSFFRVDASCDIDNKRSARAMEKAGMSFEGLLRRYMVHPNISSAPRDSLLYAITR